MSREGASAVDGAAALCASVGLRGDLPPGCGRRRGARSERAPDAQYSSASMIGQDARRDGGVGGIGRQHLHLAVVVVDLPEAADAAVLDDAEVVFAVGVVVLAEGVEGAHLREDRAALVGGQRLDAGGDHDGPADEGAAEGVVEVANSGGGSRVICGHGLLLVWIAESKRDPKGSRGGGLARADHPRRGGVRWWAGGLDCRCGVLGLRSAPHGRAAAASVRREVGTAAAIHHRSPL